MKPSKAAWSAAAIIAVAALASVLFLSKGGVAPLSGSVYEHATPSPQKAPLGLREAPDPVLPAADRSATVVREGLFEEIDLNDGETAIIVHSSRYHQARAGASDFALVSIWSSKAHIRKPARTRLIPVDELVAMKIESGAFIRATTHGMSTKRVEVLPEGAARVELQLYPVIEATVQLKDVVTQSRPHYDMLAVYLHPLRSDPAKLPLLTLSDEEEACIGLKPFRFRTESALRPTLPQWFAILDYSGQGKAVKVPIEYDIPGYEVAAGFVTAAAPGSQDSSNVVWLTPTGSPAAGFGAVEITLLDHRGFFLDDGPTVPGPAELLLVPTDVSDDLQPIKRTVVKGMGRKLLFEGIPVGDYRVFLRGPIGFGAFPADPEDAVVVRVEADEVTSAELNLDALPAVEFIDHRDPGLVTHDSWTCIITKGDISPGGGSQGVSVRFSEPPYRLPIFPAGKWSVLITSGGRSYGPYELQAQGGETAMVEVGP